MGNRRAKAPNDQRTRAATIANNENPWPKEPDLQPHQRKRKPTDHRRSAGHTLRTPSVGARHITGARIGQGGPYFDFRMSPRLTIPKNTLKLHKTRMETLPPPRGRGLQLLQGPKGRRRRDGPPERGTGNLDRFLTASSLSLVAVPVLSLFCEN